MYLQRDDGLWNLLKQSRMEYIQTFTPTSLCSWGLIPKSDMSLLVNLLEQKLGMKTDINIYHNMTLKALKAAEQMLFYIVFCPPKDLIDSTRKELENSIKINTPKEILIILNRLTHAPSKRNFLPHYETFKVFLDKISSAWNLRYKDICKLTGKQTCKDDDCEVPLNFLEEQRQNIDIILMDVSMPIMDGITATRLIRQKGINIPIIALTAHALESDKTTCMKAGMDGFVSKPVRRQEIYEAIQSLVETA